MNAAVETLQSALRIGVMVDLDGEDLILEADEEPPASVLDAIKQQKPAIVALLRRQKHAWSAEEGLAFFHERAGIAEDDGLSSEHAEAIAFECCLVE
jgi:hypothetical protein